MSSILDRFTKPCNASNRSSNDFTEQELLEFVQFAMDKENVRDLEAFVDSYSWGSWDVPLHLSYLVRELLRHHLSDVDTGFLDALLDRK
jgi:hypothetical protein